VVQSTAADIFKFGAVRVHEEVFKNTKSSIVNLVHDEIQSYVHKEELHLLNKKRDVMEDFDFLVPLKVEFQYSTTSWAEKKDIAA
jgi:DNA polymerase I-like protein with 3'-5' exonuclease and polymerase domains